MIPVEATYAAAKAAYIHHSNEPGFDAEAAWNDMAGTDDWEREQWESTARAALEAAAPYIRARALDDAKDALNPGGSYVLQNIAKWLSERAATERTTL